MFNFFRKKPSHYERWCEKIKELDQKNAFKDKAFFLLMKANKPNAATYINMYKPSKQEIIDICKLEGVDLNEPNA